MTTQAERLKQLQASKARLSRAGGIRAATSPDTQEATSGELWLYGVVGGFWFGFDAESVARELRGLDVDELTVRVNSPGGNVIDGIAIGNLLRNHRAKVTVVVDGLAASIASVLALGGDEVVMSPGSQMMIHDASLLTYGNAAQLRSDADWIDKQSANLAGIYAGRAGGTAAQWREAMQTDNGQGTWYTADEAVAAKLADKVGTVAAVGSPPVAPVEDDNEEAAALAAWDLEVLVHPAARAAWSGTSTPKPPTASAGGSPHTEGGTAMSFIDDVRTKLGVAEDADEATILAALDEALDEHAEPTSTNVPAGHVVVPEARLKDLETAAQTGVSAAKRLHEREREEFLDSVRNKYAPTNRAAWAAEYDRDPEGTRKHFENAAVIVPTDEVGHAEAGEASADDRLYVSAWGDEKKGA